MTEKQPSKAPEKFIQMLQQAMEDHPEKLSLRQVAQRANISPAYLSFLLNGVRRTPSNEAIAQLEKVLNIPPGELNRAAQKPDNQALLFFRKDESGPIMKALNEVPANRLPEVRQLLERFLKKIN